MAKQFTMAIHYRNMTQADSPSKARHFCLNRRGNRHVIVLSIELIPLCTFAAFSLTLVICHCWEFSDVTASILKAMPIRARLVVERELMQSFRKQTTTRAYKTSQASELLGKQHQSTLWHLICLAGSEQHSKTSGNLFYSLFPEY